MSATPRIVFSKTLERAPWGSWPECRIVRTDPAEEVAKLKRASGKNIVMWGSISVAQLLMKADQIDEHRLVICPAVLGDGQTTICPQRANRHEAGRRPHRSTWGPYI
jgi:dihydrofolate reductase